MYYWLSSKDVSVSGKNVRVSVRTFHMGRTTFLEYYLSRLCAKAALPCRTMYKGCATCLDYVQRLYSITCPDYLYKGCMTCPDDA